MNARKLLIVDDDPGIRSMLRWSFENCIVLEAGDRKEALAQVAEHAPAVVTLDLGLPPMPDDASEGLRTLSEILQASPNTKVIVVSGNGDRANAVKSVATGAYDFYQKPIDGEILGLIVERAFNVHELEQENRALQRGMTLGDIGLLTASASMQRICQMLAKVAPAEIPVLLLGESGTGKELLARALHRFSKRSEGPFVAINCGAIPEPLLESELFGHEKGAFTGAIRQTKGKVELAQGGTLFLDEIGDMSLTLQVKLLRFLQEQVIERVGGRVCLPVNVRLVCATHRNLGEMIADGRFREDFFYRISAVTMDIPPLRDRDEDSVLLAHHFIHQHCRTLGRRRLNLSPDAVAALRRHRWPGNVRELENRIKRAVLLAEGGLIGPADLALDAEKGEPAAKAATLREVRERAERKALLDALTLSSGNLSATAQTLGVSRPTVYSLMKQFQINWRP